MQQKVAGADDGISFGLVSLPLGKGSVLILLGRRDGWQCGLQSFGEQRSNGGPATGAFVDQLVPPRAICDFGVGRQTGRAGGGQFMHGFFGVDAGHGE